MTYERATESARGLAAEPRLGNSKTLRAALTPPKLAPASWSAAALRRFPTCAQVRQLARSAGMLPALNARSRKAGHRPALPSRREWMRLPVIAFIPRVHS